MSAKNEYIPGVCNIGSAEINRRRQAGWSGLGITILLWAAFFYFNIPAPWRLLLFFPATMSAEGFLQAAFHFCAAFGTLGVFNFGIQVGKTESVEQAEYRRKDRQMALKITIYSMIIGLMVAVGGFLIVVPH
jgi:hypothetical protein